MCACFSESGLSCKRLSLLPLYMGKSNGLAWSAGRKGTREVHARGRIVSAQWPHSRNRNDEARQYAEASTAYLVRGEVEIIHAVVTDDVADCSFVLAKLHGCVGRERRRKKKAPH